MNVAARLRSWTCALAATTMAATTMAAPITVGAAPGPLTLPDAVTVTEDARPTFIDVLGNDNLAAVLTAFTQPAHGSVAIVLEDGQTIGYTYQPFADTNDELAGGADSFTYTVEVEIEGELIAETQTATINVTATPDEPVANNDAISTVEDAPITEDGAPVDVTDLILSNDLDADGDDLTIISIDDADTLGTVTLVDGAVTYEATDQAATTDSFGYTISDDSDGALEATGTVTITIVPVDDAPVGAPDSAPVDESGAVLIPVLDNDTDVDGGDNTIASVSTPAIGSAEISGTSVLYTAPDDIDAETVATFTYQIGAIGGIDGDTVEVTVTVSPVDDAPVANADTAEVIEDGSVEIDVLGNDDDVDGGPLEITGVTDPEIGSVEFDADSITYTHAGDSLADVTFDYTVNGGSTATVTVSVLNDEANNDAPVVDDVALTIDEDADPTVVPVLTAGETDVDGTVLTITEWTSPTLGTVELNEGVLTYTPNPDANGIDSFIVTVSDGDLTDPSTVTITVEAMNDAPVALGDDFTDTWMSGYSDETVFVLEDQTTTLPLLANDTDIDSETLDVVIESIIIDPLVGSVSANETGVVFTPAPNWSGNFSFDYVITDGELESEAATVWVYVIPLSDAPVALPDFAQVDEDDVAYVSVLDNDFDVDNASIESEFGDVARLIDDRRGTWVNELEIVEVSQPENGYAVIAGDRIRVEADPDFSGELVIEYRVRSEYEPYWDPYFGSEWLDCSSIFSPFGPFGPLSSSSLDEDQSSPCLSAIGTLTVEVDGVNDAPVAMNDEAETDEDTNVTIDVLDNDSDIDGDELSIWSVGSAANGSTSVENGDVVYTPDDDFFGSDAFVYFVTDGDLVQLATVEVEVASINDDPTIADVAIEIDEDETAAFDLDLGDVEDDIESLSVGLENGPDVGEVSIDGTSVVYTPPANFFGTVSFELSVEDTDGGISTNTVEIVVASVNDLPTVDDVDGEIDEDTSFEFTLAADDVEDGTNLPITVGSEPTNGSVDIDGLTVTYTPDTDWNGSETFTLTVTDTDGGEATSTVIVDVAPVNDRPQADDIEVEVDEDGSVSFELEASDVDGDELTLELFKPAENLGTVSFDGLEITWAPSENFNGEISFEVFVRDSVGITTKAEIFGTVNAVNDAPEISPASAETNEDETVEIEIEASDIDGDDLTIAVVDEPTTGTTSVDGLVVSYTPDADANGSDSFDVEVTDVAGATSRATVTVDINPVQDAPTTAECGPYTVEAGDTISISATDCASDVDGDALTVDAASASAGSVSVDGSTVTFTAPDETGEVVIDVTVVDGNGGSAQAAVTVTVEAVPVSPYVGQTGLGGEVVRLYSAMLGREPDAGGFAFWLSQRNAGMTFEEMVNHFANSPEFVATFGNRITADTDAEWVDFMYREIMNRTPDAGGRAFWLDALSDGTFTRASMVIFFSQSPEYRDLTSTN